MILKHANERWKKLIVWYLKCFWQNVISAEATSMTCSEYDNESLSIALLDRHRLIRNKQDPATQLF